MNEQPSSVGSWITRFESPALLLLLSNIFTIILAIIFQWSILTLLWGYWVQSIIIGVFTVIKLIMFGVSAHRLGPLVGSLGSAVFFMFHYGMFHAVYGGFLLAFSSTMFYPHSFSFTPIDYTAVAIMAIIFFINHTYSFVKNYLWDKKQIATSAKQIFYEPYKRIIPMHLTIIAAGFLIALFANVELLLVVLFLLIKTLIDLRAHQQQHTNDIPPQQ